MLSLSRWVPEDNSMGWRWAQGTAVEAKADMAALSRHGTIPRARLTGLLIQAGLAQAGDSFKEGSNNVEVGNQSWRLPGAGLEMVLVVVNLPAASPSRLAPGRFGPFHEASDSGKEQQS